MTGPTPPSGFPDFLRDWECARARHAARPALCDGDRALTHAELHALTSACAARLRAAGAGPERQVGLALQRPLDFVVAIIATLKAGAAFLVPPPHAVPAALPVHLWVTRGAGAPAGAPAVDLDGCEADGATPAQWPDQPLDPAQLAYVLFTSGSVGRPRGAMVQRDNLGAFCAAVRARLRLGPEDRWFQLAVPSFDVFLEETLPVLTAGGAVVCRPGTGAPDFGTVHAAMEHGGATLVEMTTQYWLEYGRWLEAARREPPPTLRALVVGGERMDARAWRAWQARYATPLVHVYGTTETSCTSTMFQGRVDPRDDDVPVGPPLENTVLRPGGAAPDDEREIGLAGACVGRGYQRAPALTAERFRPDPLGPPGSRVYATGDHGYVNAGGALVFRARRDDQVKVRGHRLRLSAVEQALEAVDGVVQAAVLPDPQLASNLAAFVIRAHDTGDEPRLLVGAERARLASGLERHLPAWAVPGRIFALAALPHTTHGKVDREALRRLARTAPDAAGTATRAAAALPERVVHAFRTVLQAPEMQLDDNFFDFGGDSLLALALTGELAGAMGAPLSAAALFDAPTPRALSEHLARRLGTAAA